MTITVKLDPALEQELRQRAATTGRSTSDVIRAALAVYLREEHASPAPSAYDLGSDLFGRFGAGLDLARNRKRQLREIWSEKHDRRGR